MNNNGLKQHINWFGHMWMNQGQIQDGFGTDPGWIRGLIQADYRWSGGGAILKGEAVM